MHRIRGERDEIGVLASLVGYRQTQRFVERALCGKVADVENRRQVREEL
jgi:hypothetical protein